MPNQPTSKTRRHWQFGLGTLFALTTAAAVITALLTQGYLWWLLAAVIFGNALLFAVIVGLYDVDETSTSKSETPRGD